MAHRSQIDGRYGDLDCASTCVDPHRDVVKEVDEKFGESGAAPGGRSPGQEPLTRAVSIVSRPTILEGSGSRSRLTRSVGAQQSTPASDHPSVPPPLLTV